MTMMYKCIHNIFAVSKLRGCYINPVRYSALFINGAKATENFVFVIPFVDFHEKFNTKGLLEDQLRRRNANFNLTKLFELWNVYDELKAKKSEYEVHKNEITTKLSKLITSEPDGEVTKLLKLQSALFKENIKKLKAPFWSAEEAAVLEYLKLPNTLHSLTPDGANKVIYTHLHPPNNQKDHLKVGKELELINLKTNENYYLKGDAAIFELGAKFYFSNMMKQKKFVQFSNPDFVKSVIVEGCGENHTRSDASFILHHNDDSKVNVDSRLHLTGGGSLYSYFAYHAKYVLHSKVLPLKYFSMGRQYVPSKCDEDSLFHVTQSSVIEVFGAAKTDEDLDTLLEEFTTILKEIYTKLGYHFRLSLVPADKLSMWESLRLVVEMYSSSLNKYVEVGHVSLSGDYISKRLMFTYLENKKHKFPHILSGTILNVPKLLACVLEQDGEFILPELFNVQNWAV